MIEQVKQLQNEENLKVALRMNPETMISMDYYAQYDPLVFAYKGGGIEAVKDMLKEEIKSGNSFQLKEYTDLYRDYKEYKEVINLNGEARDSILKVDGLAFLLNSMMKDPDNINEEKFRRTINELNFAIYGEKNIKRDI